MTEQKIAEVSAALEDNTDQVRIRCDGVVADCVAVVEAWWRKKCSQLQNTHAPNLAEARVRAEEVEDLIRRIRSLAEDPADWRHND